MKRFALLIVAALSAMSVAIAQTTAPSQGEPEFIGEAYFVASDGGVGKLEKEIGAFTSGISWSSNSWNAQSLEIAGGRSQTRFAYGRPLRLVVRAVDNNSDPLTIISIYKFKASKKTRTVLLGKDNSGTFLKSRTNAKDLVRFEGQKHGASSYLILLDALTPGEYGIVVSNPNARDEKRIVVSCFAVD